MTAIKNGKYDIREGYPFPENKSRVLNNSPSESFQKGGNAGDNAEARDKNDVKNLEEKFQPSKGKEINTKGIIPPYATNDITKQGIYLRKKSVNRRVLVEITVSARNQIGT